MCEKKTIIIYINQQSWSFYRITGYSKEWPDYLSGLNVTYISTLRYGNIILNFKIHDCGFSYVFLFVFLLVAFTFYCVRFGVFHKSVKILTDPFDPSYFTQKSLLWLYAINDLTVCYKRFSLDATKKTKCSICVVAMLIAMGKTQNINWIHNLWHSHCKTC